MPACKFNQDVSIGSYIPLHVPAEVQTCNHASWGAPTAHADPLTPTSKWDIIANGN